MELAHVANLRPNPTRDVEIHQIKKFGSSVQVLNKGATLWSFDTRDYGEVLMQNDHPQGKPTLDNVIRGGSPKMFPIIGPGDTLDMPLHGNLRGELFTRVRDMRAFPDSDMVFEYKYDGRGYGKFPHAYCYRAHYSMPAAGEGRVLVQTDEIENLSPVPFEAQLGQHNYFNTSCKKTEVEGLEQLAYLDRQTGETQVASQKPFVLADTSGEINRLYSNVLNKVVLKDPNWGRQISLELDGYSELIVWHPDQRDLGNLDLKEHPYFICLEPCEASTKILVPAGGKVKLSQTISVEALSRFNL